MCYWKLKKNRREEESFIKSSVKIEKPPTNGIMITAVWVKQKSSNNKGLTTRTKNHKNNNINKQLP